jgi:hypothetical protein
MKIIYTAEDPVNAHLLKGILEAQGINTVVKGDSQWSFRVDLPVTPEFYPALWVLEDADFERAMKIVSDFESGDMNIETGSEEWKCDKCNEINEGQFTECWQCGTSRDMKD